MCKYLLYLLIISKQYLLHTKTQPTEQSRQQGNFFHLFLSTIVVFCILYFFQPSTYYYVGTTYYVLTTDYSMCPHRVSRQVGTYLSSQRQVSRYLGATYLLCTTQYLSRSTNYEKNGASRMEEKRGRCQLARVFKRFLIIPSDPLILALVQYSASLSFV